MPRPIRKKIPGYTYHVYSRCIETKDLMKIDYLKDKLINVLHRTMKKYTFKLIGYEILDNHFHFIIQTVKKGEDISRIMQYIKARFAEAYNREMKRTGPFWNERFKCKIIEESDDPQKYLFTLLWYMGYNPVKKKKVKDPRESRYGSINFYLEREYISVLDLTHHQYFMELGKTFKTRVKKFLQFEKYYIRKYSFDF